MVVAAATAAADAALGRLGAVGVGDPVPEQALVVDLFVIFLPELGEPVGVLDRYLNRPRGRDLRSVEAVPGAYRGRALTTGARKVPELAGVEVQAGGRRVVVLQRLDPVTGGRGQQADRRDRGAEEALAAGRSLRACGRIRAV